jgi:serine O-acetyltransferase
MFTAIRQDLKAVFDRDPAATSALEVVFTYAGFHALIAYRLSHWLKSYGVPLMPRVISQVARWLTGIEIHPSARIGTGFFIDHGMGVVIGETAEIGDFVTLFQGVTREKNEASVIRPSATMLSSVRARKFWGVSPSATT